MRFLRNTPAAAASLLLAAATMAACAEAEQPAPGSSDRTALVASFYPLQFVAEGVGGDAVAVTNLAKPGAEPHDLELSAGQVRQIADAKLVVYLHGFQPAVDDAVEQQAKDSAFDVGTVQPLRDAPPGAEEEGGDQPGQAHGGGLQGKDPHVWLDPTRLAAIGDKLADRLAAAVPDKAADFRSRAAALRAALDKLDKEYADGLKTCQRKQIVTSHAAFGYLAERYHLEQIPITGLSPEEEPSPQRLGEIAAQAKADGVTTIFFETLVSPKVAEALAKEVGARAEVLDPIEGLEPGSTDDYLSVMRANLGRLRTALGCG